MGAPETEAALTDALCQDFPSPTTVAAWADYYAAFPGTEKLELISMCLEFLTTCGRCWSCAQPAVLRQDDLLACSKRYDRESVAETAMPGAVDPTTRNVPLLLGDAFKVHFVRRNGMGFVVRISRRMPGVELEFANATALAAYLSANPRLPLAYSETDVVDWVNTRMVEPSLKHHHG